MAVLENLEPREVFSFFEEISSIPRGSGNVSRISNYLVKFAEQRGLEYYQDELKNVIIIKEATQGYEYAQPVILQGHMDMVAVKKPDCNMDLKMEGLRLGVDGDLIYAENTSLGGDDGIAIAYALALLDSDNIPHPRLEVVITVDEEVGMDGAKSIDLSMLRGTRMVNLDSEEEGIFTVGCAGGVRVDFQFSGKTEEVKGSLLKLKIGGLQGGHSGAEIHKERGNSNQIFGRILEEITKGYPARLKEVKGGLADNAIPRETTAKILVAEEYGSDGRQISYRKDAIAELLKSLYQTIKDELAVRDPDFFMEWSYEDQVTDTALNPADTRRAALFLCALPNGVQAMSPDIPGLVETSLNFGILRSKRVLGEGYLGITISVRSSVESEKAALVRRLHAIGKLAGVPCKIRGDYPGWKYRAKSPLRDRMIRLYEEMYGTQPEVVAIHAGLECGLFMSKIPELDCVSIGPNMQNIHTTEETLSISSTERVWVYLLDLLASMKD